MLTIAIMPVPAPDAGVAMAEALVAPGLAAVAAPGGAKARRGRSPGRADALHTIRRDLAAVREKVLGMPSCRRVDAVLADVDCLIDHIDNLLEA